MKIGGSDYHGRGGHSESDIGSVNLPVLALHDFLTVARPIWCGAIKDMLQSYANEPSDANLARITRFSKIRIPKGSLPPSQGEDLIDRCLSSWLTVDERRNVEFQDIRSRISNTSIKQASAEVIVEKN